jgi:hypothetical protein
VLESREQTRDLYVERSETALSKQRSCHCQTARLAFVPSYRDGSAESPFGRTGSAHAVGRHHQPSGLSFFGLTRFNRACLARGLRVER